MEMRYSYAPRVPGRAAFAYGRELGISAKDAREVAGALRGMGLSEAEKLLQDVLSFKRAIPFKRFNKGVAHREGIGAGRYPLNAVKIFMEIIENAKANAKFRGLDESRLFIKHISAHRSIHKRPYGARAFAKGPTKRSRKTNLEIILEERTASRAGKPAAERKKGVRAEVKKPVKPLAAKPAATAAAATQAKAKEAKKVDNK